MNAQEALIRRALSGDRVSQEQLWIENRGWVVMVVYAHLPRECDLEDILQDVALEYVRCIRTLREPLAFAGWLRRIAVNVTKAAGRRVQRARRATDLERAIGVPSQTHHALDVLGNLLESIPQPYHEVILLSVRSDLSVRQIASILDRPERTIETQLYRGRQLLREQYMRIDSSESIPRPIPFRQPYEPKAQPNKTERGAQSK